MLTLANLQKHLRRLPFLSSNFSAIVVPTLYYHSLIWIIYETGWKYLALQNTKKKHSQFEKRCWVKSSCSSILSYLSLFDILNLHLSSLLRLIATLGILDCRSHLFSNFILLSKHVCSVCYNVKRLKLEMIDDNKRSISKRGLTKSTLDDSSYLN